MHWHLLWICWCAWKRRPLPLTQLFTGLLVMPSRPSPGGTISAAREREISRLLSALPERRARGCGVALPTRDVTHAQTPQT